MDETTYVNIAIQSSGWTMGNKPEGDVQTYNPVWAKLLERPNSQPQKSAEVFFQQMWLPNHKYGGKEYSFNINHLAPRPHSTDPSWFQKRAVFFTPEMCDCLCIIGPPRWDDLYNSGVAPFLTNPVPQGLQDYKGQPLPILFLGLGPATQEFEVKLLQKLLETRPKQLNYYCSLPSPVTPECVEKLLELFLLIRGRAVAGSIMDWDVIGTLGPIPKTLTIKRGVGLAVADLNGKSDPYCKFGIGSGLGAWKVGPFTTKTKYKTLDPCWDPKKDNSVALIDFAKYRQYDIIIEVWDEDLVGNDRLGYCSIPVAQISNGKHVLPVKSVKNEKASGTISIDIGIANEDSALSPTKLK